MSTRRDFLKQGALLSLSPFVPRFLLESARGPSAAPGATILVVLQLDGGNDGLNTVIPWRSEEYPRLRPTIRIEPDHELKLDDEVAFHPSLRALARRFEQGQCAVIQGVGYPNPNRSHFESMRIWQTALPDAGPNESLGWLGLATDPLARASDAPPKNVFVGPIQVPVALNGRRTVTLALRRMQDLELDAPELVSGVGHAGDVSASSNDVRAFVRRVASDSYRTALELAAQARADRGTDEIPVSELDQRLQTIARLIASGSDARVYYSVQSGYDTHVHQLRFHDELLASFSEAVDRLFETLASTGDAERVVLLAFSEFGRRAAENAGKGTDHGTAGPVFLIGPRVLGGVKGATPRLDDLVDGDLRASVDFRSVYAAAVTDWLRLPDHERLRGQVALPLFRAGV